VADVKLSKYHGLGNDFVIADLRRIVDHAELLQDPAIVRRVCDRHFGVGADGVLAVLPATTRDAVARMRVLNSDGGEAEMCGNGLRCVAKYLRDRDPTLGGSEVSIDTGAGTLSCTLHPASGVVSSVTVNMGAARFERGRIPVAGPPNERCVDQSLDIHDRPFQFTCVGTGNPHAVTFVSESGDSLLALAKSAGPAVEHHARFPERTNVEFARAHSPRELELVVWERGCGITLACGTGACATVAAACVTGQAQPETDVTVRLLGGDLTIRVNADYSAMFMTGPAVHVFDFDLDVVKLSD
jgi:diaminopimelate epimerase